MIPTHQNTVQPDKPQSTKMRIKFPGIHLPVVTIVNILMSAFQISLQVDLPWQMHSFIHSFTHAFVSYLLSAYSMPGPVVIRGGMALSERDTFAS